MTSAYSVRPYTLGGKGRESGVSPSGEEYVISVLGGKSRDPFVQLAFFRTAKLRGYYSRVAKLVFF